MPKAGITIFFLISIFRPPKLLQSSSTMRGLKKCKSCGHWNGIRALNCKNKTCKQTISLTNAKKPNDSAVEIVSFDSSNETKIYTVRAKERGSEFRSFVKITDKTLSSDNDSYIISRNAICYVDTCKHDSNDINISCKHVKSSTMPVSKGIVLKITQDVLFQMNLTNELKIELWDIYCEYENVIPVVQRISHSIFVVRCKVSLHFPEGLLHVYFYEKTEAKYSCACKKKKIALDPNDTYKITHDRCDHLFLVLAAILSNESLKIEFESFVAKYSDLIGGFHVNAQILEDNFIDEDFTNFPESILNDSPGNNQSNEINFVTDVEFINPVCLDLDENIPNNNIELVGFESLDCQIELMDEFKLTDQIDMCTSGFELSVNDSSIITNFDEFDNAFNGISSENLEITKKQLIKQKVVKKLENIIEISERTSLEFSCWLASVVERIHLAMDFNANGKPEKMLFSIPHVFFQCISTRFTNGNKRRLPNSIFIIDASNSNSKTLVGLVAHTYIFTNLNMVKNILKTEHIELNVEQRFTKKSCGTFCKIEEDVEIENCDQKSYAKVRPTEYQTFLKVGSFDVSFYQLFFYFY